tara:strand:+ start:180 stop:653 length:474 start_codon:yes stop_codon:yes gene_type:complete
MLPELINENGEWFSGFLKESEVSDRWGVDFQSTVSKGYPEHVCENMYMIAKFNGEEIIAHTSFSDMGSWYFIGNNYVKPVHRKNGILKEMVTRRNQRLGHYPKIAILRPIEETCLNELTTFLKTLNYAKVESYDDVSDIMGFSEYDLIEQEELWRCD